MMSRYTGLMKLPISAGQLIIHTTMRTNKYQDNPLMTIVILVCLFLHGALAYTNWGHEWSRSLVAVLSMFVAVFIGYMIREGVKE